MGKVSGRKSYQEAEPTTFLGRLKNRLLYSLTVDIHKVRGRRDARVPADCALGQEWAVWGVHVL
jgi:hypothetical protein